MSKSTKKLPLKAKDYLDRLADLAGVPVAIIGVGRGREQTINIHEVF